MPWIWNLLEINCVDKYVLAIVCIKYKFLYDPGWFKFCWVITLICWCKHHKYSFASSVCVRVMVNWEVYWFTGLLEQWDAAGRLLRCSALWEAMWLDRNAGVILIRRSSSELWRGPMHDKGLKCLFFQMNQYKFT